MSLSGIEVNAYWKDNFDLDYTLDNLGKAGYTFDTWLDLATKEELKEFVNTLIQHEKYELISIVEKKIETMI